MITKKKVNVGQLQIIEDKEDYRFFFDNVKNYQF